MIQDNISEYITRPILARGSNGHERWKAQMKRIEIEVITDWIRNLSLNTICTTFLLALKDLVSGATPSPLEL